MAEQSFRTNDSTGSRRTTATSSSSSVATGFPPLSASSASSSRSSTSSNSNSNTNTNSNSNSLLASSSSSSSNPNMPLLPTQFPPLDFSMDPQNQYFMPFSPNPNLLQVHSPGFTSQFSPASDAALLQQFQNDALLNSVNMNVNLNLINSSSNMNAGDLSDSSLLLPSPPPQHQQHLQHEQHHDQQRLQHEHQPQHQQQQLGSPQGEASADNSRPRRTLRTRTQVTNYGSPASSAPASPSVTPLNRRRRNSSASSQADQSKERRRGDRLEPPERSQFNSDAEFTAALKQFEEKEQKRLKNNFARE